MTTEQLPDGLQLAEKLLAESEYISEAIDCARDAIRAEHAQRLTLQHHAADQAQRIEDLEGEQMRRVQAVKALNEIHETCGEEPWEYRRIALAALADDERAAASMSASPLLERIADLETKCDTLKRLHDAAADERDKAHQDAISVAVERDELRSQIDACTPHLRERLDETLESPADMLAMREREVLGLLGRLRDAQMQGDALRAQMAEIEAQEPVAWIEHEWSGSGNRKLHFERRPACLRDEVVAPVWTPLYVRPVPAIPDGWRLVPVEPTEGMLYAEAEASGPAWRAMLAVAPEYTA